MNIQHTQPHPATASLARVVGNIRDKAGELQAALVAGQDAVHALWNDEAAGVPDAARCIAKDLNMAVSNVAAHAGEAARLMGKVRDALGRSPHFDTRLGYATRAYEAPPTAGAISPAADVREAQSVAQAAGATFTADM